ncbi:efflux RND transporter periplasmic adaptor subunit, partial [bacterium]|nr:efflux RND transporter periplasmic adaptor subunit [bacterium]
MKLKRKNLVSAGLVILLLLILVGLYSITIDKPQAGEHSYQDLYVCAMHPWEMSDGPGSCDLCGMNLSNVQGHQAGDPLPAEDDLYVSPDDPLNVHLGPGTDPQSGKKLIPITQSPYYQPRESNREQHSEMTSEAASSNGLWTCGMHPDVIQDEPGICPICKMALVPLKTSSGSGSATVQIDAVTLQNIGVTTETVTYRQLSHEIRTNGTVQIAEDGQARVNARISGWVEKLYVSRTGDQVKKGEKLLEIYSPELVSAQEEYLLALQSANTLRSGSAQSITTNADNLVQAAQRRLELWNIEADQIQQIRESGQVQRTLALVSPMDGIVLHKNVIEGDRISQGMNLFLIADLKEVWIEAQVYDYELPFIAKGDAAMVSSTYDPSFQYKGIIDYIYPVLDNKTRSATVRLVVPNSGLRLMPNMYVAAEILPELREQSLTVPKSAVIRSGKEDLVFVSVGDGKFEPRQVHLGVESDQFYEISGGLQAGEKVVTSAQFLLDSEANLQEAIQRR